MKKIIMTCICLFALPLTARPQGQGERIELSPWWDRPVARNLGLSADQLKQVRAIIRDTRDSLIKLRAEVELAEASLADEFSEDPISESKTNAAIEKVVSTRAKLLRAVTRMSLKLRQVLTYRQWQELRRRGIEQSTNPLQKRQRNRLDN